MIINPVPTPPPPINTPTAPPTSGQPVPVEEPASQTIDLAHAAITALTSTRAGRRALSQALSATRTSQ